MRELKFRAWVNDHWTDFLPTCQTLGEYNACVIDTEGYTYEKDNPFIVEQYTGLKDKNGKEIYEGDIVKMPLDLAIRQVGFVDFVNGRFLIKDYEWEDGSYHIVDFFDYNIPKRDFEVIGNIHENPELLEEEK